jgi:hypothetical protein
VAFNTAAKGGGVFVTIPEDHTLSSIIASNKAPQRHAGRLLGRFPTGQSGGPGDANETNVFRSTLGILNPSKIANDKVADPRLMALGASYRRARSEQDSGPSPPAAPARRSKRHPLAVRAAPVARSRTENYTTSAPSRGGCDIGAVGAALTTRPGGSALGPGARLSAGAMHCA